MPNGYHEPADASVWNAIDTIRTQVQKVSEDSAVTKSQYATIIQAITDSEGRTNVRLDRSRNVQLAVLAITVPVVSAAAIAILQGFA